MKKLLKFFAVPAILALGLLVGCSNDLDSIDLNVTVSTDTPQLDNPKNLGYGVLLTWRQVKDGGSFKVTRQAKGGEEKELGIVSDTRYFDAVNFGNVLETGVEYTYRVYNTNDRKEHYDSQIVIKDSCAEKKITLEEGSIKAHGEKLPAPTVDEVVYQFAEEFYNEKDQGVFRFSLKKDDAFGVVWAEVRDPNNGMWLQGYNNAVWPIEDKDEIEVQIYRSLNNYYRESDSTSLGVIKLEKKAVGIESFFAYKKNGIIELTWKTDEGVEASVFTIERREESGNAYKTLALTPTSEIKLENDKRVMSWTAVDSDIVVGKNYIYRIKTTRDNSYYTVSTRPDPYDLRNFEAKVYNKVGADDVLKITKAEDYVVVSFDGNPDAVTYKGWWTTFDNKGTESEKRPITFNEDGDSHFRAQLTAADLGVEANTSVKRVSFYGEAFVDGKLVGAANKTIDVDVYLTSYTYLDSFSASESDFTKREITVFAEGQKFTETDKVTVTYFKDDSANFGSTTLTWVAVPDVPNKYSAKFIVAEDGYYTICARLPMANMYDYDPDNSVFMKNATVSVTKTE